MAVRCGYGPARRSQAYGKRLLECILCILYRRAPVHVSQRYVRHRLSLSKSLLTDEAPVWLLQKLPTGKYLGVCIIGWGLSTACHAALKDNVGLVVVRVFCGIFEAAVPSALMLLSSQYYNRSEQTVRYSYWYCGMGVGQILGGLSSWGFQHIVRPPTAALQGWKIMFLSLGLATLFIGALICVAVPDTPMKAWFLSDEEKVSLLEHIKSNQTGIEGKKFQPKHLKEGAMDPQLWLMMLIVTLVSSMFSSVQSHY